MANKAKLEVELIDDVSRPAKRARKSLKKLEDSAIGAGRGSSGISRLTGALFSLKGVLIGAGLVFAVKKLGEAVLGMADFSQRAAVAFDRLASKGEGPRQVFREGIDLAKKYGLDIVDTTKALQKFRALQFNQDQSKALIKMSTDMQALGASAEEVKRIQLQLGQIMSKGKLQGEELIVLAENGLSTQLVYEQLQKRLGKTRKEVLKLQQAGKLGASDALNAIGEAILRKTHTQQFGEAGKQLADSTLSGLAGQLKAKAQDALLGLGERVAPALTEVFKKVSGDLGGFFDGPTGVAFFASVGDGIVMIVKGLVKLMPLAKEFISGFGKGASETFSKLTGVFSGGAGSLDMWIPIVGSLGRSIGELVVLGGALAVGFTAAAGVLVVGANLIWNVLKSRFDFVVNKIGAVVFAFTDFFADISAIFNAEGLNLWEKATGIGRKIVEGFVAGIKSLANLPREVIKELVFGTINSAKSALGIESPSKVFANIGKQTVAGYNQGISNEQPAVQGTVAEMGKGAADAASVGGVGATSNVINFAPRVVVNLSGSATQEDGESFATGAMETFEREFNRLLEGTALAAAV